MELRDGGLCVSGGGQTPRWAGRERSRNSNCVERGFQTRCDERAETALTYSRVKIRTVDTANSANGRGQAGRAAAVLSAKRRTPKADAVLDVDAAIKASTQRCAAV